MTERLADAVCVYCASSGSCDAEYHRVARRLGEILARAGRTVVYGGSRIGSMGALADGALGAGGRVIGVMPQFLKDLEVSHAGITELHVVDDMHARKRLMLSRSAAVVALPGGSGTIEELMEAITLKRLGVFLGPIIIVNTRGYFLPLLQMFEAAVRERFMDARHLAMWQVVDDPEQVMPALLAAPPWTVAARQFATL